MSRKFATKNIAISALVTDVFVKKNNLLFKQRFVTFIVNATISGIYLSGLNKPPYLYSVSITYLTLIINLKLRPPLWDRQ